jgi:ADP-ribose pyrophosphatase YjhB (NUDIX family)
MKKVITTNCLIVEGEKILLGMHKRGAGKGKWNGFGGKVHKYEQIGEAARRELLEECGIIAEDVELFGTLTFEYEGKEKIMEMSIFKVTKFAGTPSESKEMTPKWFDIHQIPFEDMWEDDKEWLPMFLAGKKFTGRFVFDSHNAVLESSLVEV